jgi:two-component system, cell cycle sensor histidine kinase and response regulator CckA
MPAQQAGWVLILRDITEERQHQEYQQAQERLATVGQLAAGVAHDFNNIMAVISLYAELILKSGDPGPQNRERLLTISQQAERAASLTGQILDFSRRSVMERASFEIVPFLKEFVNLVQRTLPESILIGFVCDDDQYLVNADPTRLQQVLMNLSLNARDAMPAGGELRLELTGLNLEPNQRPPLADMQPGKWLVLTITDTGAGIAPDHLLHIFEPFFSTKPPGRGTGLGLAQAYGIIRQHGGHIAVSSQAGRGTTFQIYLPGLALNDHSGRGPDEAEDLSLHGRGETILLVEDDNDARAAVRATLELYGYRVIEATNGHDGLAQFEEHAGEIDLVLSDLVMPVMGGEALFRALRQREEPAKTVLMTGYPLEGGGRALLEQGLVAWISKPFSADQIAGIIKEALG